MINDHKLRPNFTYAIPIINPIRPTVIDLEDKSFECLNPKMKACNKTAITVAKDDLENSFSNQFIKNPLSNNSSKNDSIRTAGIMVKNSNQFPFRSPNLEAELSSVTSCTARNGIESSTMLKIIRDTTVATKIPAETIKVFLMLSGLRSPKSFQVIFRTFIRQIAIIKVENDQKSPFTKK